MSAQGYYEDQLEEAMENLLKFYLYRTEAQPKGKIVTRNFDDEEARE